MVFRGPCQHQPFCVSVWIPPDRENWKTQPDIHLTLRKRYYPGDMLCFQELHSAPVQERSKRSRTLLEVGEPHGVWHFASNSHFNSVGFSELVPAHKTLCTCSLNFCSLRMSQLNKHKRMLAKGSGDRRDYHKFSYSWGWVICGLNSALEFLGGIKFSKTFSLNCKLA